MHKRNQRMVDNYREILAKLQHYCAYRERCLQEVIVKLKESGAEQMMLAKIIDQLNKENFINEKRYAEVFARGKFIINKWGKHKIIAELRKKDIPEQFIKSGLNEIKDNEYISTLKSLIKKKSDSLHKSDISNQFAKLAAYATTKGYESELVWNILKNMKNDKR